MAETHPQEQSVHEGPRNRGTRSADAGGAGFEFPQFVLEQWSPRHYGAGHRT